MPRDRLTAVLVNWRRAGATLRTVDRLRAWQRPPALVVVDNGSPTAAAQRLRAALAEGEWIAAGDNVGFGAAHNLALQRVDCEYVLLLNDDVEIGEAAVDALCGLLDRRPEIGIAGPLLVQHDGGRARATAGGRDIGRYAGTHVPWEAIDRSTDEMVEVDYVPGTAAVVRTELLRELDGLEEAYFFSGEMADLADRARERGAQSAILIGARATHDLTAAGELRTHLYAYYSLRNRFLFVDRRRPRQRRRLRWWWTLRGTLQAVRALLRGRLGQARALAAAVAHGRAGRFGRAPGHFEP